MKGKTERREGWTRSDNNDDDDDDDNGGDDV